MTKVMTKGVHHIGLTCEDVEKSAHFFVTLLGWKEVKRKPEYPAIFVSDGKIMMTLWQVQTDNPTPFDRKQNIGLHHLALQVQSSDHLDQLDATFRQHDIHIEFGPEPLGNSPAKHMMVYEPGGSRVEFFWDGVSV